MRGELPEAFKVERSRRETARLEGSEGEGGKPGSFESGTGFAFDAEPGRPASWEEAAKRSLPTDPLPSIRWRTWEERPPASVP